MYNVIIHYTHTLWNDDHTIKLISTSTTFFVWELLMSFFFSNFQVYNSVLLTVVTMLYIRSLRFTHLITERYSFFIIKYSWSFSLPSLLPASVLLIGWFRWWFYREIFHQEIFCCSDIWTNFLEGDKQSKTASENVQKNFFIIIDRSIYP